MSFGNKILVGLALGLAVGLFLGDLAAPLQVAAQAYVRLLQMTVLPYVTVSLVVGIGSLDPTTARRLFLRVGALTLALWGLALGAVFLMPLVFPSLESASFFSTTLVETPPPVDFVALYIPSNPFHSLANSIVPAVVLFSGLLGIALMGVPGKQGLIGPLRTVESALARANRISVDEVGPHDRILDVGPKTAARLAEIIANAGTIVWNGPVGVFEHAQFAGGTKMLASAIAHSEAFSIAGGGDTLAAIAKFHIADDVGYISTGGGAFLEFLEGKTLPAIAALEARYNG